MDKEHAQIIVRIKILQKDTKTSFIVWSRFHTRGNKQCFKENKNKAAGYDIMYPKFLKFSGPKICTWQATFYSDILRSGQLPKLFKRAKVIALLKPGKDGFYGADFQPISLISVPFKLLGRIILEHIQSHIDKLVSIEQAGF